MAVNTKAIKGRIKTVKNTKKITKAMEMVAAAKMRKAVEAAANTRLYALLTRELMEHLGHIDVPNIPMLEERVVKRVLAIVVSSNRGLCGSFNGNLFKKTAREFGDVQKLSTHVGNSDIAPSENVAVDMIAVGKKAVSFGKKQGYEVIAAYDTISDTPSYDEVLPVADMAVQAFLEKKYDKVVVSFTEFKTSLVQQAMTMQLLPISPAHIEEIVEKTDELRQEEIGDDERFPIENYLFEPSWDAIMEEVMPRLIEIQLYQAVLESSASEHSARMVAMKSATDAAGDMITDLTRMFNKGRQAAITQEIAEIASGAAALN